MWQAIRHPIPVTRMRDSRAMAPALFCRACWKRARMGTPVGVERIGSRLVTLKNMAMQ